MKLIGGGSFVLFLIKYSEYINFWNKIIEVFVVVNIYELWGVYEEVYLVVIWINVEIIVEISGENGVESKYLV